MIGKSFFLGSRNNPRMNQGFGIIQNESKLLKLIKNAMKKMYE